ncbi:MULTISPECIES: serine hydrolase [unclassified Paenibacillus]|uniref:serine hydrolase n=1 Tax=unclassified Paenibacillus TaxID=185978 RepID=UPI000CFBF0EE|nr:MULTISPECIES: serine hydrolase [unclassified Paenibacillus]PRA08520.1 penicillin-binding protein [Paenibacillus sp. MYb63]PRA48453.1 penicillin-binding protein [Paenibacillus sp. MYb67]QZN78363.1 serine hydrolase [Paenibacillus sp. DR312]
MHLSKRKTRFRFTSLTGAFMAVVLSLSLWVPAVQAETATPVAAEQGKTKALTTESATAFLDSFFDSPEAKPHYVGASVFVVKDGKVLAEKGYGFSDVESKTAIDPKNTAFRVASVSKTFTSAAVMQLVEQGKVDLQADFQTYVKGLEFDNPFHKPVTVENLLTHTTGFEIRDPQQEDIHTDFDKYIAMEDYAQQHMPPVVREPGSAYMYDNFSFLLLGMIVENVSGEPFESYMQQHIFKPLGMDNSSFMLDKKFQKQLATGYDAAHNPLDLYTISPTPMPHGGMLSTAEDIGKFMIAFLNDGVKGNERILKESTVKSMEQYRSSIHPLLPNTTYGFEAAFQLPGAGSSPKIITKAGDLAGFSSYLVLIPEQNTGVFLTYNQNGALRNLFYPAFIQSFFPQYAEPVQFKDYTPQSAAELQRFTGLYADLRISTIVSSLKNAGKEPGQLSISDVFLGQRNLIQMEDNLFKDELTGQFTAFKKNADGTIYMKEPYLNPMGYEKKGQKPMGFRDVRDNSPYAEAIYAIQSLGYYENDANKSFQPKSAVTRAEFIENTLKLSGLKPSKTTPPAGTDWADHAAAGYIQLGYEMGMITGKDKQQFKPDQVIIRQEAMVMMWRILQLQYPSELFTDVKLAGHTDPWAVPAVQMMAKLGIHGPEVKVFEDGSVDFLSRKPLIRQEEAAIMYALLTQPTDQIVAELMAAQQPQAEPSEEAEAVEETSETAPVPVPAPVPSAASAQ